MGVFPDWNTRPLGSISLSAGGLLALADLSTIAQRTAIVGGSSWLDSLLLAPGLHMQQATHDLLQNNVSGEPLLSAVETLHNGQSYSFSINNAATRHYIQKIARPGEIVTLDVGSLPTKKSRFRLKRSNSGMHATVWAEDKMPDLGWVSHLLYLISPVLTVAALVFLFFLRDFWSFGSLIALMISRLLNIIIIKRRGQGSSPPSKEPPSPAPGGQRGLDMFKSSANAPPASSSKASVMTEYLVSLGDHQVVLLRGMSDDLQAITQHAWLRAKTHVEGYLEAAAKLVVYLVAATSGNMTQAGALVFMLLLLVSAALLALSNANAKSFRMNGRVAAPLPPYPTGRPSETRFPVGGTLSTETSYGAERMRPEPTPGKPPYPVGRAGETRLPRGGTMSTESTFESVPVGAAAGRRRDVRNPHPNITSAHPFVDSVDYV